MYIITSFTFTPFTHPYGIVNHIINRVFRVHLQ